MAKKDSLRGGTKTPNIYELYEVIIMDDLLTSKPIMVS